MNEPPQVVVAAVGDPESPATWSGTTVGVLAGLRELGVPALGLDLTLPRGVEQATLVAGAALSRNRYDAHSAGLTVGLRSLEARRRLRELGADGAIQVGTTFSLPRELPFVTLEDMTLRQAASIHPVFSRMSRAAVEGWERRRARIYEQARMCCVASRWVADSLIDDYGIAPERIAVVGLGANHRFEAMRERSWSPARFLFVGVDWERKGGPLLLRAFARLRERHPDATLDLVGGHPPVEQLGVRPHGMLSRGSARNRELIPDLFARASCFVMPSSIEPFGIVHIEAASAGIPSIASSVGGPRDVLGADGGLLVDPGDEDGLLHAMCRMADPATARRMGQAAQERSHLYTWTKVSERLLRALGLQLPGWGEPAAFL